MSDLFQNDAENHSWHTHFMAVWIICFLVGICIFVLIMNGICWYIGGSCCKERQARRQHGTQVFARSQPMGRIACHAAAEGVSTGEMVALAAEVVSTADLETAEVQREDLV